MKFFSYQNQKLACESVYLEDIAQEVGTPFYVYSHEALKAQYTSFDDAFFDIEHLVCYSAKANTNLAILKIFANLGGGLDVVSGGELYRGLKAGFNPQKIVYSGVGKRPDEIDMALREGILMFNVESLEELFVINARAEKLGKKAPISFRVNPDVDPQTHPYISTGLQKNKFGVDIPTAIEGYKKAQELKNIEIVGMDCHIGSQITSVSPFQDTVKNLKGVLDNLKEMGVSLKYMDLGGGLGIQYHDENPPSPTEYAKPFIDFLKDEDVTLILEPGRSMVGNAGALITQVLYRKQNHSKEFVVVDAGMNDLMRPSLYHAYHGILPVTQNNNPIITADVVGPICESGDFLAADREIPDFKQGDLLAVMSAGAYGFTMSSNYCSRLRVPEVLVHHHEYHVVRTRETYDDLTRGESLPPHLK